MKQKPEQHSPGGKPKRPPRRRTERKVRIGALLKKLRIKHKLKTDEVAKELGIHKKSLYYLETGICEPMGQTMEKIQKLYHVTAEFIWSGGKVSGMDGDNVKVMAAELDQLDPEDRGKILDKFDFLVKHYAKSKSRRGGQS